MQEFQVNTNDYRVFTFVVYCYFVGIFKIRRLLHRYLQMAFVIFYLFIRRYLVFVYVLYRRYSVFVNNLRSTILGRISIIAMFLFKQNSIVIRFLRQWSVFAFLVFKHCFIAGRVKWRPRIVGRGFLVMNLGGFLFRCHSFAKLYIAAPIIWPFLSCFPNRFGQMKMGRSAEQRAYGCCCWRQLSV